MRITLDDTGNIFSITPDDNAPTGTIVTGTIPDDLLNTFAFGKYTFDKNTGVLTAVPGWVAPPPMPPGML